MSGDPWFKFYPSDWISGVSGLSAAERGVYVTLLAIMYDRGGPIIRDDVRLARQCGLPKHGFTRALEALISAGKITQDGSSIFNERTKTLLTEQQFRSLSASKNASSRWEKTKQNQCEKNADAIRAQCETDAIRARLPEPELYRCSDISNEISSHSSPAAPDDAPEPASQKAERKPVDRELIQSVVAEWNALAASMGLSQVTHITPKRQAWVVARAKELVGYYDYPDAITGFRQGLFARIRGSPFLRGESSNWRCDFDFAFNLSSFTKIMEGRYEGQKTAAASQRGRFRA